MFLSRINDEVFSFQSWEVYRRIYKRKKSTYLSEIVQKINDRILILQAGAKIEGLKDLMEDCWKKMDEVEKAYQKLRAFNIPLISEDIRENCSLSNSSQFTNQTMQSAMSILRYFENLHFNDKPITVNTQSTWKIDVPENPLAKKIVKLSKTNPTLISGRPLWSKNMPKIYENPKILQIRLNTLQRLVRLSRITE